MLFFPLELLADKELYNACDTEVKRQIWQDNQALFGDEVSPLLSRYIKEKEGILFGNQTGALFFSTSPKQRRQLEVHMLYNNLLIQSNSSLHYTNTNLFFWTANLRLKTIASYPLILSKF